jgi:hypothetical protein
VVDDEVGGAGEPAVETRIGDIELGFAATGMEIPE